MGDERKERGGGDRRRRTRKNTKEREGEMMKKGKKIKEKLVEISTSHNVPRGRGLLTC